jgi:hypothetical protein
MAINTDDPLPRNEEFRRQTPEVYKWAVGAGGLVIAATTAALAFKPETAGYSLSGLILFILLIIVVINLEMGTAKQDESNSLAKMARMQVTILSCVTTFSIVVGATFITSSILFRWPRDPFPDEDKTTESYLSSIKAYYLLDYSFFERDSPGPGSGWVEKLQANNSTIHTLTVDHFNGDFLTLSDPKRNIKIRIPTQGGMLEWSKNERFTDCDLQYCWGDVGQAKMSRYQLR